MGHFWPNLRLGRESVTFRSEDELLESGVKPQELANPDYVRAAPMAPNVQSFDAVGADLFGMTAREAEICDPALRLFLEVSHTAIEEAGDAVGEGFGVFASSGPCLYRDHYLRPPAADGRRSPSAGRCRASGACSHWAAA